MKLCSKCGFMKELYRFGKDLRKKSGLTSECKICKNKLCKEWSLKNKERHAATRAAWREKHREYHKQYSRLWLQDNLGRHSERERLRSDIKKLATPMWLSKDQIKYMKDLYLNARILSKFFNERCEVDHIVPLQSKNVTGLHVPWNLQVVTKEYNQKKFLNSEVSHF